MGRRESSDETLLNACRTSEGEPLPNWSRVYCDGDVRVGSPPVVQFMSEITAASAAMYERDSVARELGIGITHSEDGLAVVSMTVEEKMTNGLDVCHGGILFTLADTAMAYASNAAGERSLSTSASIEWLATARIGDHLIATCRTVARRGRNTIHDITITNGNGDTIALLRGQTLTLGGSVSDG